MEITSSQVNQEQEAEAVFSQLLQSPAACAKLSEVFYDHLNNDNLAIDSNSIRFAQILFSAYEKQDVNALLLELCQRSLFDLLREACLIPKQFHGKAGQNPVLLTNDAGEPIGSPQKTVSRHDLQKLKEIREQRQGIPHSRLYLADGYDITRSYTGPSEIQEMRSNPRRGVFILYGLLDSDALHLTKAQAYSIVWNTFCSIQRCAPSALVYYGQETGQQASRFFDEIGILLPIHQFERRMLEHLQDIDRLILECREEGIKKGTDSPAL